LNHGYPFALLSLVTALGGAPPLRSESSTPAADTTPVSLCRSLFDRSGSLVHRLRDWFRARAQQRELDDLTDALLDDVGLRRNADGSLARSLPKPLIVDFRSCAAGSTCSG